jgi:acyl-homoserine lactone acylase PvdQ
VLSRLLLELASLSEKELETKVRELENWNFRLNLDEGAAYRPAFLIELLNALIERLRCGVLS